MESIDIFWTGGLDSTYRVLELILIQKRKIKPYYIIDSSRPSALNEMRAMDNIRLQLNARVPHSRELLTQVNLVLKEDIKKNEKVTGWYENLASRLRLGIQFEWLSRFAYEIGLNEIELCFEKHPVGKETDFFKLLSRNIKGTGHDCRLASFEDPNLKLFKNYRLPVIHLTKLDLRKKAREYGFHEMLELIWFCHKPTLNGSICGTCRPCQLVRESGFGNEFRFNSDLLHNRFKRKLKAFAKTTYRAFCSN